MILTLERFRDPVTRFRFAWAVTSLIDSAIRICAFLKFQPIENLQPLMGALMPGGTLHYYNHESKEEFSTVGFSLVGWEGGTVLRDKG